MRKNLIKRMLDEDITQKDIAKTLGVSEKTAKRKIDGKADFKFQETIALKHKYFANDKLETLFADV